MKRISFHHVNRRTHLYLALFLLPWVVVYGVSSVVFNHNEAVQGWFGDKGPRWTLLDERPYERAVPENPERYRAFGREVLEDVGLSGAFGVSRQGEGRINIYRRDFGSNERISYFIGEKRLVVERREMQPHHRLVEIHARGGYHQDGLGDDLWAVVVDLVSFSFVLWVVSGLIMWWRIPRLRWWGAAALAGGVVSFGAFLVLL